jgi:membrane protease YdiL (CAAX protease family)
MQTEVGFYTSEAVQWYQQVRGGADTYADRAKKRHLIRTNPDMGTSVQGSHSLSHQTAYAMGVTGPDSSETTSAENRPPVSEGRQLFMAGLLFEAMLALAAIAWAAWRELPLLGDIGWSVDALGMSVLATLPLIAALLLMVRVEAPWMQEIEEHVRSFLVPLLRYGGLPGMALLAIAAGVGEELLFRGVLQAELAMLWGPWSALVVASIVFGLCHWITPAYAIIATIMGAYLGGLYWYTGGLLVPVLVHTLYDFVAFVYFAKTQPSAQ